MRISLTGHQTGCLKMIEKADEGDRLNLQAVREGGLTYALLA